jgi:hypothetical protein
MTKFEIRDNEMVTAKQAATDYLNDLYAMMRNPEFRLEAAKCADHIGLWDNKLSGDDKCQVYFWFYVEMRKQERLHGVDILERWR